MLSFSLNDVFLEVTYKKKRVTFFDNQNRYLISDIRYQISVKYVQVKRSIKSKADIDSAFLIFHH
jgi:hypothetical protein